MAERLSPAEIRIIRRRRRVFAIAKGALAIVIAKIGLGSRGMHV